MSQLDPINDDWISMSERILVINLIQDIATPHNNSLISKFKGCEGVKIKLWYAKTADRTLYQWSKDLTNEHYRADIYGKSLNLNFLKYCLSHRNEKFVIVGWMNINTKLLHLLFLLLRRNFNHWSDLPRPVTGGKLLTRWISYKLLRLSKARVFGVGKITLNHFRALGFPESRLVNLPVFIEVRGDVSDNRARRVAALEKYGIDEKKYLVSSGSRLLYEKGYDVLINAISLLDPRIRSNIKVIIIGSGDAYDSLCQLSENLKLSEQIVYEKWLDPDDFNQLIAGSNVFVHPARFDAFGGTALAMSLGITVIGSRGAGAAVERIEHGVNGFLYDPEDAQALALHITELFADREKNERMSFKALETAMLWPPSKGVEILCKNVI